MCLIIHKSQVGNIKKMCMHNGLTCEIVQTFK